MYYSLILVSKSLATPFRGLGTNAISASYSPWSWAVTGGFEAFFGAFFEAFGVFGGFGVCCWVCWVG